MFPELGGPSSTPRPCCCSCPVRLPWLRPLPACRPGFVPSSRLSTRMLSLRPLIEEQKKKINKSLWEKQPEPGLWSCPGGSRRVPECGAPRVGLCRREVSTGTDTPFQQPGKASQKLWVGLFSCDPCLSHARGERWREVCAPSCRLQGSERGGGARGKGVGFILMALQTPNTPGN